MEEASVEQVELLNFASRHAMTVGGRRYPQFDRHGPLSFPRRLRPMWRDVTKHRSKSGEGLRDSPMSTYVLSDLVVLERCMEQLTSRIEVQRILIDHLVSAGLATDRATEALLNLQKILEGLEIRVQRVHLSN